MEEHLSFLPPFPLSLRALSKAAAVCLTSGQVSGAGAVGAGLLAAPLERLPVVVRPPRGLLEVVLGTVKNLEHAFQVGSLFGKD